MWGTPPRDAEAVSMRHVRSVLATLMSLLPRHGYDSETRWQQRGVCSQDTVVTARHGGKSEEFVAKTR